MDETKAILRFFLGSAGSNSMAETVAATVGLMVVLCQYSEFHHPNGDDVFYEDYFSVDSRDEAAELNEKYDGFQLEKEFKGKKILF